MERGRRKERENERLERGRGWEEAAREVEKERVSLWGEMETGRRKEK